MLKSRSFPLLAVVVFVLQFPVWAQKTPAPGGGATAASVKASGDAERRRQTFELVWQTVKDNHFDPTFGGLVWENVREEFSPRVARAHSDRELHTLLQEMLNRLGQSHFNIIPPESIPSVASDDDEADPEAGGKEPEAALRSYEGLEVAERMQHGLRVDLRVINRAVVITRVDVGSTAEAAGLRPGFALQSVDGVSMRSILRMMERNVVFQPQSRNQISAEILFGFINGAPRTKVDLVYLDGANRVHRISVNREKLKGEMSPPFQSLPAQFLEFESKRLKGGVGYIRVNLFLLPVMEKFCEALRSMNDAPGIVLDLRGNRGGLLGVIYGISGMLESRAVPLGTMRTRAGYMEFKVFPQKGAYRGQLVILIDRTSQSASEILTSGLKEWGRALVVGEQSSGSTLPSAAKALPTGAILQYAIADFWTPGGNRLEGVGVNPDINVKLDRRGLLSGRDPQLQAAIDAIGAPTRPALSPAALLEVEPPSLDVEKAVGEVNVPAVVEKPVEEIIERYVKSVGGPQALARISSRVSKGKIEGIYMGIKFGGPLEILEKTPDRSVTILRMPNVGEVRKGFTGEYGYEQVPLFGFRKLDSYELAETKLTSALNLGADLKRLYRKLVLDGKAMVGASQANVIQATTADGLPVKLYFDIATGLLVRRDDTFFEDFREVDGVKVPFTVRDSYSVITLSRVEHNVSFDDASFSEHKDCFNR
jgi:carboxyl-terminal processing protease